MGLTITGVLAGCRGILGIEPLPGEVSGDAGAGDAAAADAGATDALVDSGPSYCKTISPVPRFCADFDERNFELGWDNDTDADIPDPGEIGGGTLSADLKVSLSKPASLLVQTPYKLSNAGNLAAIVVKTVPSTSRLQLEFELQVDSADLSVMGTGITVAGLDYGNDGDIEIFLDSEGLELAVEGTDPDAGPISVQHVGSFPVGTWTSIQVIVSTVPAAGQPGGWVNVESEAGGTATAALPLLIENRIAQTFLVVLGSSPGGPVGAFQANFDNVRMYWK
jgi:hypothetical protein